MPDTVLCNVPMDRTMLALYRRQASLGPCGNQNGCLKTLSLLGSLPTRTAGSHNCFLRQFVVYAMSFFYECFDALIFIFVIRCDNPSLKKRKLWLNKTSHRMTADIPIRLAQVTELFTYTLLLLARLFPNICARLTTIFFPTPRMEKFFGWSS